VEEEGGTRHARQDELLAWSKPDGDAYDAVIISLFRNPECSVKEGGFGVAKKRLVDKVC
jgi:hypothetical protein